MDGDAELGLQRVDCAGPVDRCTGPFIGAVTQAFQPTGLYVLVRKPAVDAKAAQPTQRGDRFSGPLLQQLIYFRAHATTNRRRKRSKLNLLLRLA